ncbi:T3SS effector HopA1 family protein [Gordonia malaquae]|uniref:T3SS effector HopA1 family protein n=1 Tax=Gordonia malaquae TaxID=410332 RepID=UPI0030FEE582
MHIDPGCEAVLDAVTVDADGCRADVGGTVLEAASARELEGRMAGALYERFHARKITDDVDDDFSHLRDFGFERRLAEPAADVTTSHRVDVVERTDTGGVALIAGVRVALSVDQLASIVTDRGVETLRTSASRPALSPGFFLVRVTPGARPLSGPLLRLYIGLADEEAGVRAWSLLLDHLGPASCGWQAKVLSNPAHYPRTDGLVVYLDSTGWGGLPRLIRELDASGVASGETSHYVHRAAPGIGVAFEPRDPRPDRAGLSFGQHRSRVIGHALVSAALAGDSHDDRRARLVGDLLGAGIDPSSLARNLGSPAVAGVGIPV